MARVLSSATALGFAIATLLNSGASIAKSAGAIRYCGAPADTRAIERLAAAADGTDRTAVMSILVVDAYARALVESKGEDMLYFAKQKGRWSLRGRTQPKNLPASVSRRFSTVAQSTKVCGNPHFVNHPSGP